LLDKVPSNDLKKGGPTLAKITFPIEATHILMFARAIGDENPVYHDAEKAKDTEAGGIIAPPTFAAAVAQFNPDGSRPRPGEKWFGSGKGADRHRRQGSVGRRVKRRTTYRVTAVRLTEET
jgi:hypothetical protein